jgi:hypothetical protein
MMNTALADYRSKHLHKGSSRGSGGSRIYRPNNNSSSGSSSGRCGNVSRNNGRGGHHGAYKDRSFKNQNKNRKSESKSVGFKQNGAHTTNVALPPPPYTPAPEQHFAFKASHEPFVKADHEEKQVQTEASKYIYDVYPDKATLVSNFGAADKEEIEYTEYDVFVSPEASDGEDDEDSSSEDSSSDDSMILDQCTTIDLESSEDSSDDEEQPTKKKASQPVVLRTSCHDQGALGHQHRHREFPEA